MSAANSSPRPSEVASFRKTLDSRVLRRSQLPDMLEDERGEIRKPDTW
jgi:hypothetical protein